MDKTTLYLPSDLKHALADAGRRPFNILLWSGLFLASCVRLLAVV